MNVKKEGMMNALKLAVVGASCSCLALPCLAQDSGDAKSSIHAPIPVGASVPSTPLQEWASNLEQAGIVNRTQPGPRFSLPLMSFDNSGSTLSAAYASMPGSTSKAVQVFVRIPLR